MTEAEWLKCNDPTPMIAFMRTRLSVRKQRLLLGACCRRVERLLRRESIHTFLADSDRFADGEITLQRLKEAYWSCGGTDPLALFTPSDGRLTEAENAVHGLSHNLDLDHMVCAVRAVVEESGVHADLIVDAFLDEAEQARITAEHEVRYELAASPERVAQAQLVRDVFGNPFRPVAFSPSWRTDTAVTLARTMYDARDFSAMPILADALQDAGCDSADVLDHCRGPGPHVRGCWVRDLVLGRK